MSRMQLPQRRAPESTLVLVREGDGPQVTSRPAAIFLWANLCATTSSAQKVPSPLFVDVPCRSLLSLLVDGTHATLLLWEELGYASLFRDRLRARLELRYRLRTNDALWRAYLSPTMS